MEITQDQPQPRVRLSSPADVLAVVPHLFGFHPDHSLVVIGAAGEPEHVELGFRYDLPDPPDAAAAAEIAEHAVRVLAHRGAASVIAVGYGPGPLVTPAVDALATAVAGRRGLRLREVMRVDGGRYWSYLCRDVTCCPAEGVPFDYRSHPAAAAMTVAGLAAYPDRDARAAAVAPVTGQAAEAMDRALERASARAAALVAEAAGRPGGSTLRLVIDAGRRAVGEAIALYRCGGSIIDPDQFAWLMVTLANLPVRDDAWARMVPEHRAAHLALWSDVVRHATGVWLPAPAALLAFTAWQSGDGALASMALERALAADPGYSMALLLREILDAGVPPSQARLPMTPEEVAASYDRAERGRGARKVTKRTGRKPARRKPGGQ